MLLPKRSYPVSQKKSDGAPKPNTGSNYATQLKKQEEVNGIFSQLKTKYEGKFKSEQLHTWAHMIYLKTHDSLDNPPDINLFSVGKESVLLLSPPSHLCQRNQPLVVLYLLEKESTLDKNYLTNLKNVNILLIRGQSLKKCLMNFDSPF